MGRHFSERPRAMVINVYTTFKEYDIRSLILVSQYPVYTDYYVIDLKTAALGFLVRLIDFGCYNRMRIH